MEIRLKHLYSGATSGVAIAVVIHALAALSTVMARALYIPTLLISPVVLGFIIYRLLRTDSKKALFISMLIMLASFLACIRGFYAITMGVVRSIQKNKYGENHLILMHGEGFAFAAVYSYVLCLLNSFIGTITAYRNTKKKEECDKPKA